MVTPEMVGHAKVLLQSTGGGDYREKNSSICPDVREAMERRLLNEFKSDCNSLELATAVESAVSCGGAAMANFTLSGSFSYFQFRSHTLSQKVCKHHSHWQKLLNL